MNGNIVKVRTLSIWIFLIPFIAVNICLYITTNLHSLIEQPYRLFNTFPYIDGGTSISRTARYFPNYLIFKPAMFLTAIFLFIYWKNNNQLINNLNSSNFNYKFKTFGILSAIFLVIHSILLGVKFDFQIYKLFRRVVLLLFIIFEIIAQGMLVYHFYKLKRKLEELINKKILILKIILVIVLALVGILSLPILITKGNTHFKHALEWHYFVGVITFYLFSRFCWRRTT